MNKFRLLLLPLSLVYGLMVWMRNFLYDKGIFKSKTFAVPVICIGNLSTGGTGKTPHVEYCIQILTDKYKVAVLSRGYKRKTTGFLKIENGMNASDCGDEPLQMFNKFKDAHFFVGENRVDAIESIIATHKPDVIIMDDGLQHRAVNPSLKILLTAYDNLFTHDFMLPAGNLREQKSRAAHTHAIVITKTPAYQSVAGQQAVVNSIKKYFNTVNSSQPELLNKPILLSHYQYGHLIDFNIVSNKLSKDYFCNHHLIIFTALANPLSLIDYVKQISQTTSKILFTDHHQFTDGDLNNLKKEFNSITILPKAIVISEKDAARITEPHLKEITSTLPVYILPITVSFSEQSERIFAETIISHVRKNKSNNPIH